MNTPATRWKRRAAARPDEILDAALDVFIEAGFDAARMDDIAAKAGISKAGVYLYFDSKEALLRALISREIAPIAAALAALAEGGADDPVGTIRMLGTLAASRLANPRIFAVPRLMISISNRFPDIAVHYRTEVVERAKGALEMLIAAGIARGIFRRIDPEAAVRAVVGPLMFAALWRHALGGESTAAPEEIVTTHIDLLLNGLRP
ncbi:MAG: TetR/AcrR family transcriptional regulator [Micropepsaceae bacterium]